MASHEQRNVRPRAETKDFSENAAKAKKLSRALAQRSGERLEASIDHELNVEGLRRELQQQWITLRVRLERDEASWKVDKKELMEEVE